LLWTLFLAVTAIRGKLTVRRTSTVNAIVERCAQVAVFGSLNDPVATLGGNTGLHGGRTLPPGFDHTERAATIGAHGIAIIAGFTGIDDAVSARRWPESARGCAAAGAVGGAEITLLVAGDDPVAADRDAGAPYAASPAPFDLTAGAASVAVERVAVIAHLIGDENAVSTASPDVRLTPYGNDILLASGGNDVSLASGGNDVSLASGCKRIRAAPRFGGETRIPSAEVNVLAASK
jgi:hypothetical protein